MAEVSAKNLCMNIPFSSPEQALLASEVLKVDKELKGSGVRREITTNGLQLIVFKFSWCGPEETKSCCKCISEEYNIDTENYRFISSRLIFPLVTMPEHTPAPTPARSLYGFFMYVFSKTLMGIFLIWAFVPDSYLHYFSIYYYPLKYWSTAVPIQCLVALTLFAFFIYPSFNLILTTRIDSINTIQDPFSHYINEVNVKPCSIENVCRCIEGSKCRKESIVSPREFIENTVPPLHDLNISTVCRKLYLNKEFVK